MTSNVTDDGAVSVSGRGSATVGCESTSRAPGRVTATTSLAHSSAAFGNLSSHGPRGAATVGRVIGNPSPLVPVRVSEIATWSIEQMLSESQDSAVRPTAAETVRQLVEAYILALLSCPGPGVPQNSAELGADAFRAVRDAVDQQTALYYLSARCGLLMCAR